MEKVNYKYSQSEMVAYLLLKGYTYNKIEVKENKRYKGNYKVFFYIEGFKDELIKLEQDFKSNTNICLQDYINEQFQIKKIIANAIRSSKDSEEQRRVSL
jgi:hypothetical protein